MSAFTSASRRLPADLPAGGCGKPHPHFFIGGKNGNLGQMYQLNGCHDSGNPQGSCSVGVPGRFHDAGNARAVSAAERRRQRTKQQKIKSRAGNTAL